MEAALPYPVCGNKKRPETCHCTIPSFVMLVLSEAHPVYVVVVPRRRRVSCTAHWHLCQVPLTPVHHWVVRFSRGLEVQTCFIPTRKAAAVLLIKQRQWNPLFLSWFVSDKWFDQKRKKENHQLHVQQFQKVILPYLPTQTVALLFQSWPRPNIYCIFLSLKFMPAPVALQLLDTSTPVLPEGISPLSCSLLFCPWWELIHSQVS